MNNETDLQAPNIDEQAEQFGLAFDDALKNGSSYIKITYDKETNGMSFKHISKENIKDSTLILVGNGVDII